MLALPLPFFLPLPLCLPLPLLTSVLLPFFLSNKPLNSLELLNSEIKRGIPPPPPVLLTAVLTFVLLHLGTEVLLAIGTKVGE